MGRVREGTWTVKTGTDADATNVDLHPEEATVTRLASLPVPPALGPNSPRLAPHEFKTYIVRNVQVTSDTLENDGDYHIVLSDGTSSLVSEGPHPACVDTTSAVACYIPVARKAASDALNPTTTRKDPLGVLATVIGVAFFDLEHGQIGAAPNDIELHPVLAICFGLDCDPEK